MERRVHLFIQSDARYEAVSLRKKLNGLLILHTVLVLCVSPGFFFEATEKDGVKNC